MKGTTLAVALAYVLLLAATHAQVSYYASDVPVTISCTVKLSVPAVNDINSDTGKPDARLPLVEEASWSISDRNGNVISDNYAAGTKIAVFKIDNLAILSQLVADGVIPSVRGYSITATYDSQSGYTLHAVNRSDSYDISLSISTGEMEALSYSISDITLYGPSDTIRSISHKGSSSFESISVIQSDSLSATGLIKGSTSDFSWIQDRTDPSSIQYIQLPGKNSISGITGTFSTQDNSGNSVAALLQGSITFGASRAVINSASF